MLPSESIASYLIKSRLFMYMMIEVTSSTQYQFILRVASQGTKLGPTLFNFYLNDTPGVVKNGLELYADDSKLFGPAASTEYCSSL